MSTLPTGTITFLFTDLEGSTQLWETLPDAMRVDLARHDALLREALTAHGGHIFKTVGDAFCVAFPRAPDALNAALDCQRALLGASWAVPAPGLRARIALHTGEAQERAGDYFGPALSRVARMRDAAHGGQTVLCQATERLVRDNDLLPTGSRLRDLGAHRFKDLARPEQIFLFLHPDLPDDFPPLRSLDRQPNNLPHRLDSFIGRERDLAEVKRLLTSSRLLTLTGMGGTGKTRLSQQVAAESAEHYPQGVWLVALEALTDPALVTQAVAAAVGLREQPGQPLTATLCDALQSQRTLLILDNCEHLIHACAHLAQTLLQACPTLQILATSREPLGINGEVTYPVPPLPVPDVGSGGAPDRLRDEFESVRLFVERAAQSQPSFTLTAQNSSAVAQICRQLDGIPLAIELAAPRVRMLSVEQISQRLGDRFRLLTGGARTALPRQQTMRALIDWSRDLLSEPERLLFRRLSVFAGGWTLEAAEHVCIGDGIEDYDVLELLSSLVSKSLVLVDEDEGGANRYRMMETLRQYSWEQVLASPSARPLRERHRDWFLALAERAEPELRGAEQADWLNRLQADHDNMRAALAWSETETRLRLASALHRFWLTRGYLGEGRRWLETVTDEKLLAFSPQLRAKSLSAAGILAWAQGEYTTAKSLQQETLRLYEEQGDQSGTAYALKNLGIVSDFLSEHDEAGQYYRESLGHFREINDSWNIASVLLNMGAHLVIMKEYTSAAPLLEESLPLWTSIGDHSAVALVLYNLGQVAFQQMEWQRALFYLQDCLRIQSRIGDQRDIAFSLFFSACAEEALGNHYCAAVLLGASDTAREMVKISFHNANRRQHEQLSEELCDNLGTRTFAAATTEGKSMTITQAVNYACTQGSTLTRGGQNVP